MEKFNFGKEYILENDRVRLSPMNSDAVKVFSDFSTQQPELWKFSLVSASGLDNLKVYIDYALEGRAEETSYPFVVFDKHTNQIAGSTRFYDFQEKHNTVQLGYTWYGKKFQGTGLNKECKLLMLTFAFETLDLDRVEFRADANNARSIAAMKSIGCTVEGILRSNCAAPEGRRDSIVLSILKDEWYLEVKNNLLLKIENETNLSGN